MNLELMNKEIILINDKIIYDKGIRRNDAL